MARPSAQDVARRLVILKHQVALFLAGPPDETRRAVNQEPQEQADERRALLVAEGLWGAMTEEEQAFVSATPSMWIFEQIADASWRTEPAVVLLWALGKVPELPAPDTQADVDLLGVVPLKDTKDFITCASLRPQHETDAMRDLAELWHWRSREWDLQRKRDHPPPELRERGYESWDDIVRETARLAYQENLLPRTIDYDFPFRGKAYRDLSEDEWSEANLIAWERHRALNWLCGYAPDNQWDKTPTDT